MTDRCVAELACEVADAVRSKLDRGQKFGGIVWRCMELLLQRLKPGNILM